MTAPSDPAADWYPDPLDRGAYRYWDGAHWTEWIADGGESRPDPSGLPDDLPAPTIFAPPSPGTAAAAVPGAQPSAMQRYRSISGLATALTWLLGAAIVSAAALAIACVNRLSKVNAFEDNGTVSALNDLDDADDVVSAMASILGAISLAIFVVFIVYLYRASKNTELWDTTPRTWTPGWTIAGWFIPIANFVIPALVVSDIWRRTPEPSPNPEYGRRDSTGIVWLWWVPFVIGYIGSRLDIDPDTFSAARSQDWINIVASIVLAASAIPLIAIVRTLARRQQRTAFPSAPPV
jgi:hypothetical protein